MLNRLPSRHSQRCLDSQSEGAQMAVVPAADFVARCKACWKHKFAGDLLHG